MYVTTQIRRLIPHLRAHAHLTEALRDAAHGTAQTTCGDGECENSNCFVLERHGWAWQRLGTKKREAVPATSELAVTPSPIQSSLSHSENFKPAHTSLDGRFHNEP